MIVAELQDVRLCECGCGRQVTWHQGRPRRFVLGHNSRLGDPRPEYVVDENGCWVWQRALSVNGYGVLNRLGEQQAHRVFYREAQGEIPPGLQLDHLCRVRACVNPDHLEPVTNAENRRRGIGTKLTADDVRAIRASTARGVDLARRYGVTQQAIFRIRKRLCWKDIA